MTPMSKNRECVTQLEPDEIPTSWYNIQADLPEPLPPPLDPTTLKPISPNVLERIFAKELVAQEMSTERFVKIPDRQLGRYVGKWVARCLAS